jgi:hypothetical protein
MGLVVIEELLPGLTHRVRIVEELAVHLIDEPNIGAEFGGVEGCARVGH